MGQFVGFAHHESVKGKAPVKRCTGQQLGRGARGLGGAGFCGGFGAGLGIGACRAGRGHTELNAAHLCPGMGQFMQDQIAKILLDVIAQKAGWHVENGNTIADIGKFDRFDPVGEVVLPHHAQQTLPQLAPLFLRHSIPAWQPIRTSTFVVIKKSIL